MLVKAIMRIHSSEKISQEGKRGRECAVTEKKELLYCEVDTNESLYTPFTKVS